MKYYYIDEKLTYDYIRFEECINLNGCYVNDFSIKYSGIEDRLEAVEAKYACFDGKTDLSNVKIEQDLNFEGTIFIGDVSFENVILKENGDFRKVTFNKSVTFHGATFEKFAFFQQARFFEHDRFTETVFNGRVYMDKIKISSGDFEFTSFKDRIYLYDVEIDDLRSKELIFRDASYSLKNYDIDRSDDYYYVYMKTRRKQKSNLISKVIEWFIADLFTKYGTSWMSVVRASFFVIFGFGLLYWFFDGISPGSCFFQSMYFSVVTFTTLGYGDFLPNSGIFRFFAASEALLGAILIAGFLTTLARKYMR